MLRIGRVYGAVVQSDHERIRQAQEIFRENFPEVGSYAEKFPEMLNQPFKRGFTAVLLVSETGASKVTGFALLLRFPETNSALLDYLAVRRNARGKGFGSALYEACREHLAGLGMRGLYFEAAPDDATLVKDERVLRENRRRLAFYEQYGVRPLLGTDYETPIDADPAPYLLFDGLGRTDPLSRAECRAVVRLILRRKYSDVVSPDYIERVVESIIDDPVRFREPRYVREERADASVHLGRLAKQMALAVCGDVHVAHQVRDRGYVERPARVDALLAAVQALGVFDMAPIRHVGEKLITAVHDRDYVTYLQTVCRGLKENQAVYPYVFPVRRPERRPRELAVRAGYYCIDTFTPLSRTAYEAARAAVSAAVTGAEELLAGRDSAYALCRPPGHHAERRVFGGFCYLNNAAIAAQRLVGEGKVAILDIDYHHGNGTQDIFYERADVLTVSIHGHPNDAYPYFSGFADETGAGAGLGCNRNFPLAEGIDGPGYEAVFSKALGCVERFRPTFLVVSIGFDTMKGDPTGAFRVDAETLRRMGQRLAQLGLPLLVVQEGGYNRRNLQRGATAFFTGVARGLAERLA